MFKIKDSRGRESTTLAFVTIGFLVVTVRFALAGLTLTLGGDELSFPSMTGGEYAMAAGAILAVWLGREWTDKVKSNG